ncbi:MAG: DUF488 family protein [Dethiobacter sp.]|jgi:uncharacterized protein YeaO (DUF488 family)|nr:DUF488 family protein [Dethiobacter sp.]
MNKPAGKLYTSNPGGLRHLNCEAEIWQITRSGTLIPGTIIVRALAPSQELFSKYLTTWKNLSPTDWWPEYDSQFLQELESTEKKEILRLLYKKLLSGTNVVLLCLCKDYNYCHRKLIGEFFTKYGLEVPELSLNKPKEEKPVQSTIFWE